MDVIFLVIANICNIGVSAKRRDIFREAQVDSILKGFGSGKLEEV